MTIYQINSLLEYQNLAECEIVLDEEIKIIPASIKFSNSLFIVQAENEIVVFDAELAKLTSFQTESKQNFLIDNYMFGTIADGKLIVRDFDGENRRELSSANGRAFITKDNQYIYYLKQEANLISLIREKIIE